MTNSYAIITPTYKNDYALAIDLCESIEKYLPNLLTHYLVIPYSDRRLFSSLKSSRRKIIYKEDVLREAGFKHLPAPTSVSIPGLRTIRLNEQWISPNFQRTSGWIIQQLIKLSAPSYTDAENLLFVDSDVVFIRSFDPNDVLHNGKLPLHKHENNVNKPTHITWINKGLCTLKIERDKFELASYIGSIVFWRRENILKLQSYIERINEDRWQMHLSMENNFSEYMLYGLYCTNILGDASLQQVTELKICHTLWEPNGDTLDDFLSQIGPGHVAIHIQSFLSDKSKRRGYVAEVEKLIERGNYQ